MNVGVWLQRAGVAGGRVKTRLLAARVQPEAPILIHRLEQRACWDNTSLTPRISESFQTVPPAGDQIFKPVSP